MLPPASYQPADEFDGEIFDRLVPADHYLRQVLAVVDFERCRQELVSCYSPDQGRPAIEPTLLLKLEFLQYHYNLSDREVVEQSRYNLAFRYFLGLSLDASAERLGVPTGTVKRRLHDARRRLRALLMPTIAEESP